MTSIEKAKRTTKNKTTNNHSADCFVWIVGSFDRSIDRSSVFVVRREKNNEREWLLRTFVDAVDARLPAVARADGPTSSLSSRVGSSAGPLVIAGRRFVAVYVVEEVLFRQFRFLFDFVRVRIVLRPRDCSFRSSD